MKYYLCKIGSFQNGGEEQIKDDCLQKNIYQYYNGVRQKGAGNAIQNGDVLILVFRKNIVAYGVSCGCLGDECGIDNDWQAVKVEKWIKTEKNVPLPYGVWWHTLVGNKQSIVKEIDALWANDLIIQIIMSNSNELMPKTTVINLHLPSVASFLKNGFLAIPAVQRGKVWNAVRTEVLWDSLLRGIPIGSLSIRPVENEKCWQLLDGQQRSNAIALGYMDFNNNDECNSILWIDLGMNSAETEQEDKKIKHSNRRFFFRVTTQAHPWGYKLSDNETNNKTLKAWEQREAINQIDANLKEKKGKRPQPYELWPVDAIFPVPFTLLRQFCEQNQDKKLDDFLLFCRQKNNWNWLAHLEIVKNSETGQEIYEQANIIFEGLCKKLNKLNETIIVAQNVTGISDEDVGLYFKRMNKAGIEPSNSEIRYSLLKSRVPELKQLDEIANNRMQPSRIADIAMKTFFILAEEKWKNEIDNRDIQYLVNSKKEFNEYISNKFSDCIRIVEEWLLFDSENNPMGLPRFIFSSIARSNSQDFYSLLIYFAAKGYNFDNEANKKNLIALITLICWFGVNKRAMAANGYKIYQQNQGDWEEKTRQWLFQSIKENLLMIPPTPEIYTDIKNAVEKKDWELLQTTWNPLGYRNALNTIWWWHKEESRQLLLYACRKYLNNEFPEYDPADAVWCEENRPWDYDHIFPQAWLRSRKKGNYRELVETFLNSIGNIAPLDFSQNRGKGDCPPGNYQGQDGNLLLLIDAENNGNFFTEDNRMELEDSKENAYTFAAITALRLERLYSAWYQDLELDKLLDFSTVRDSRNDMFKKILNRNKDTKCFYVAETGQQKEITTQADWGRNWLTVGIETEHNGQKCLKCICSNGDIWEVGYRRHPEATEIDGNYHKWWFWKQIKTKEQLKELDSEFIELLKITDEL